MNNIAGIKTINCYNTQNKYYDLTGKVIANPQKGKVYIYNNKKIVY